MMCRHFALSSELTGAIAKRLLYAKNHLSAPGNFFNQFVTEIYTVDPRLSEPRLSDTSIIRTVCSSTTHFIKYFSIEFVKIMCPDN